MFLVCAFIGSREFPRPVYGEHFPQSAVKVLNGPLNFS
jgi:hypothetical protein